MNLQKLIKDLTVKEMRLLMEARSAARKKENNFPIETSSNYSYLSNTQIRGLFYNSSEFSDPFDLFLHLTVQQWLERTAVYEVEDKLKESFVNKALAHLENVEERFAN